MSCFIDNYYVKQLSIFEHTELTASDFNDCTMVNCDLVNKLISTPMSIDVPRPLSNDLWTVLFQKVDA